MLATLTKLCEQLFLVKHHYYVSTVAVVAAIIKIVAETAKTAKTFFVSTCVFCCGLAASGNCMNSQSRVAPTVFIQAVGGKPTFGWEWVDASKRLNRRSVGVCVFNCVLYLVDWHMVAHSNFGFFATTFFFYCCCWFVNFPRQFFTLTCFAVVFVTVVVCHIYKYTCGPMSTWLLPKQCHNSGALATASNETAMATELKVQHFNIFPTLVT